MDNAAPIRTCKITKIKTGIGIKINDQKVTSTPLQPIISKIKNPKIAGINMPNDFFNSKMKQTSILEKNNLLAVTGNVINTLLSSAKNKERIKVYVTVNKLSTTMTVKKIVNVGRTTSYLLIKPIKDNKKSKPKAIPPMTMNLSRPKTID